MAGVNPSRILRVGPWDGGWQPSTPAVRLEPNQLSQFYNALPGFNGTVTARFSDETEYDASEDLSHIFCLQATVSTGAWAGTAPIVVALQADASASPTGGGFYWGEFGSGSVSSWTRYTGVDLWTTLSGSALDVSAAGVAFGGAIYITSPYTDLAAKYTDAAGAWSTVTLTTFDGTSARFPRCHALAVKDDVVWAGAVYDGGTEYPRRLHWSNVADAETWGDADYIDVGSESDGEIRALQVLGTDLLIFLDRAVYLLVGRSEASYTLHKLTDEFGCDDQRRVATYGGSVFFYDRFAGLVNYDGSGFVPMSDQILTEETNYFYWLDPTFRKVKSVYVRDGRLYLSFLTSGSGSMRSYVLDLKQGIWSVQSLGWYDVVDVVELGTEWNESWGVYASSTDNGVRKLLVDGAVTPRVSTGWLRPSATGGQARLTRVRLLFDRYDSAGSVTLNVYSDLDDDTAFYTGTLAPSAALGADGGPMQFEFTGVGLDRFEWVKFQVEWVAAAALEDRLVEIEASVTSLDRVRGETL